ncbi:MAG: hypothetical protein SCK70_02465 [bacterium]|nr:hypothetical protein [bacterium]
MFNKIIGDSQFELEFAALLENCADIVSFAKNYQSLGFKIEYQGEDDNIHEFIPGFLIKQSELACAEGDLSACGHVQAGAAGRRDVYIAETKGREDFDDVRKIKRLQVCCDDINAAQNERRYIPLYVKQEVWEKHKKDLKSFNDIIKLCMLK